MLCEFRLKKKMCMFMLGSLLNDVFIVVFIALALNLI